MNNPFAPFKIGLFTLIHSKLLRALFLALVASGSVLLFITSGKTSDSPLVISEFRLRGPQGANDEFVEIYNNTDSDHTVASSDGSPGYALAASDGTIRFIIPNGTIIPARGHFLGVNSIGYSLSAYPADNSTTATGNASFSLNIPDNAGIALFKTSNAEAFTLENRFDAVGSTAEANANYKEGAGYAAIVPFNIDYTLWRHIPAVGGDAGLPRDSNDNVNDFMFLDTNGTNAGAEQRLGAPGPENLSAPRQGTDIDNSILDPAQAETDSPNLVRDFAGDPANNSTFGTLSIRRTFTNNTGVNITRLRFRIVSLTTFPSFPLISDLRPRSSDAIGVPLTGGSTVAVNGTTLEQPPMQPNGGGFNSSMSATSVTPTSPLPAGGSINLQFLMGVQQTGCFQFAVVAEALPGGGSDIWFIEGDTEGSAGSCGSPTPTPTPDASPSPSPVPSPTSSPTPFPSPGGTTLIISEFRLRGPNGANDEFVEIYNNSDTGVNVLALDGSSGYGLARFGRSSAFHHSQRHHHSRARALPRHKQLAYSLSGYPAGDGATAFGNTIFTT